MKKRKGLTIKMNFSNRWLYTLIAIGILAIIGVGVYAYGTTVPSTFGHSAGELAPPSPCISNQVLQWSGTAWTCITLPSQAQWPYLQDIKVTTATHNGNFGGYQTMYNWIQANGCSGYHVCTPNEVTNALQIGTNPLADNTGAWYNAGVAATYPKGTDSSVIVNDCQGWTYAGDSAMGTLFYKVNTVYQGTLYNYTQPSDTYCSVSTGRVLCCK